MVEFLGIESILHPVLQDAKSWALRRADDHVLPTIAIEIQQREASGILLEVST